MSALPPEADMLIVGINVCYVPEADIFDLPMIFASAASARRRLRYSHRPIRVMFARNTSRPRIAGALFGGSTSVGGTIASHPTVVFGRTSEKTSAMSQAFRDQICGVQGPPHPSRERCDR